MIGPISGFSILFHWSVFMSHYNIFNYISHIILFQYIVRLAFLFVCFSSYFFLVFLPNKLYNQLVLLCGEKNLLVFLFGLHLMHRLF